MRYRIMKESIDGTFVTCRYWDKSMRYRIMKESIDGTFVTCNQLSNFVIIFAVVRDLIRRPSAAAITSHYHRRYKSRRPTKRHNSQTRKTICCRRRERSTPTGNVFVTNVQNGQRLSWHVFEYALFQRFRDERPKWTAPILTCFRVCSIFIVRVYVCDCWAHREQVLYRVFILCNISIRVVLLLCVVRTRKTAKRQPRAIHCIKLNKTRQH